jgi:hypothetical protein
VVGGTVTRPAPRFVMRFKDWCLRCVAYTEHNGFSEAGGTQASIGVCAGCQLAHTVRQ